MGNITATAICVHLRFTGRDADLDTIASSIAYSWIASTAHKTPTIALLQLEREDIHLRPENVHALNLSLLDASHKDLLTLSDIPSSSRFPSTKFALVDHNRLLHRYTVDNPDATVVGVIDHHEDEGLYKDTAEPRVITVPTGSCSSLVTRLLEEACPEQVPPDLATLLICAILIDTDGLKLGGKAEQSDRDAADFLAPRSVLGPALPLQSAPQPAGSPPPKPHKLERAPAIKALTKTLQTMKFGIESLSTRDLLRRDYKEYSLTPSWSSSNQINIGLATVPLNLKTWLPKDPEFWESTEGWINERGLAALGILTSYRVKQIGRGGLGKHRRQILFVVKDQDGAGELEERLWKGLEGSEELKVERRDWSVKKYGAKLVEVGQKKRARLYTQGNVKATRKAVAPLVKKIVEGEGKDGGGDKATAPVPEEQGTKT